MNDSFKSIGVFHRNIWYKVLDLNLLKSKNTQEDTPVMIPFISQEERNISSPCHETSFIPIIPIISRYRPSFIQVTTRNRLKRAISRYNIDEFKSVLGFRQVTKYTYSLTPHKLFLKKGLPNMFKIYKYKLEIMIYI